MDIKIRLEEEKDYKEVEFLTREAFWNVYMPGCNEHLLVHKIRKVSAFIKELSYVACIGDKIVGNIMYSIGKVISEDKDEYEVLTLGPIGVLPNHQGNGIGSRLIEFTIKKARANGFRVIILFGNPKYYGRFGFENAEKYNIKTSQGENFDEFMVLDLCDVGLADINGMFYEDKVFKMDEDELVEFEKSFPYKEKKVTDTQLKQ